MRAIYRGGLNCNEVLESFAREHFVLQGLKKYMPHIKVIQTALYFFGINKEVEVFTWNLWRVIA